MRSMSLFLFEFIEPGAACFHVFLPGGIGRIELRQPFGNFEACLGVDNRVRPTLLLRLELRNLIKGYRQIALPPGVAGVARRQLVPNRQAIAVSPCRVIQLALRHRHVAELIVGNRQVALPLGVAGVARRQLVP